MPQDAKHHIILQKNHHVTKVIVTTLSFNVWSLKKRAHSVPVARQVLGYSCKFSGTQAARKVF